MKIKDLISHLESIAPSTLQESYDNSGLQIGDANATIEKGLVCLDCTEAVVLEAVEKGCGLIIAHHPLIFGGLKRLTGADHVQRTVLSLIKHNVAFYAIHTNLDNVIDGVNGRFAEVLGLTKERVLRPKSGRLLKLGVHVPKENFAKVRDALFSAGAGQIGNYSACSFSLEGEGTFRPETGSNPQVGSIGAFEVSSEMRLEVILFDWRKSQVLAALHEAHMYEEVAYDLIKLENEHKGIGSGLIGEFKEEMSQEDFLRHVKTSLDVPFIRHSGFTNGSIKRVAICGGSGSFLLPDAVRAGADAFLTADLKYHQFQEPDGRLLMVDAGHYETEQATMHLIRDVVGEKFPKFALHLTETISNPIHYA